MEIQTCYHTDGCVFLRFLRLDGKTGEAWLQLPNSQTSRHNVEIEGVEVKNGSELYQIIDSLLIELSELYPDKVERSLLYAGCDVDDIFNITENWQDGWRRYTLELKDGSIEHYREVPGDVSDDNDIYLIKEE